MTDINTTWKAKLPSGLTGTVRLQGNADGVQVLYSRYTRLGERLLKNAGQERAILGNYIRQEFGLPRGEGNMTRLEWIGV
jgi:hypothetical protein